MTRRTVRSTAVMAVFTLVVLSIVGTALASETRYGDSAPFPDTCNIYGQSWSQQDALNYVAAWTTEESDCARLQTKMRYRTTGGSWVTVDTGWKFVSMVSTGYKAALPWTNPDWSDHNGDNNSSGTTYGFRIDW